MNWKHEIIQPDDGGQAIHLDRLGAPGCEVDIIHLRDGNFHVEAACGAAGEIVIGQASSLHEAQMLARRWLIERAAATLVAAGAEGVWLLHKAKYAEMNYVATDEINSASLYFEPPSGLLVLARFDDGDGKREGLEFL